MSLYSDVSIRQIKKDSLFSDCSQDELLDSKVQELHRALENLKFFMEQLSGEKEESLEKEIIDYSGKEQIISHPKQQILKLCVKRIQKMLRNKKTKKNWNQNDIEILVWVLNKYTAFHAKKSINTFDQADWKFISSLIPATSWKKCMFKWLSLKKFSLMAYRWSKGESELLSKLVSRNGKKDWKKLAEELYISNISSEKIFRTPKQCREHWNCYVNPSIKKGPWDVQEDIKLLQSVLELNCMKKWSQVAKGIKGRTENAVKNRFSLLLQKEKRQSGEQNQRQIINRILFRLLQEESRGQGQMRSEELQGIQIPNQIFQESKSFQLRANAQMDENKVLKINTSEVLQSQKSEEKVRRSIIIPTVIHSQPMYTEPQYYPMCTGFNPYFFNLLYGGHYSLN